MTKVDHLLALEKEKEASIAMAAIDSRIKPELCCNENNDTKIEQIPIFLFENYSPVKKRNTISTYMENI